jgi:hypothetical protein
MSFAHGGRRACLLMSTVEGKRADLMWISADTLEETR